MARSLAAAPWTVEPAGDGAAVPAAVAGRVFPAAVPGCVHTDLVRAAVIEHPNRRFAERDAAWIGRTGWRYRCRFDVTAEEMTHERLDLVVDGLDTIAALELNGAPLGDAASMFHPHRFDLRAAVAGEGEPTALAITIRAPLPYVEAQERRLGARPVNGDWDPYVFMRKMACNFGWDWAPRVPTCGIWGCVALHAWSTARLASVRPLVVEAGPERAVLEVAAEVAAAGDRTESPAVIRAVLRAPDRREIAAEAAVNGSAGVARARIEIERPALWWPRGLGEPVLHDLDVTLVAGERVIDRWTAGIGLRTVRLDQTPDAHGSAFAIEVNGTPVFCRGANWVPDGLFPGEMTPERLRRRVGQAAAANLNMLRVWGGGRYEDEAFYDACDEAGLLVWQDFMFACASYPEEPPYPALVEAEARHQVSRLCRHPSVVLWCGGNENFEGHECWGWKERIPPGLSWGRGYWLDLLPRVTAELDPTRPYWPDSPYSGAPERNPRDPDHGDRHTWDRRLGRCREIVPRFVSEFGHQSPPNLATLREALAPEAPEFGTEADLHRQRATGGHGPQYDELVAWFAAPASYEAWHYQAQLLQARAVAMAIEWLRANRPRCMGALFWQLNDAWAGHSCSAIDAAGRRKPLWYAVRRACAPRLLTIQPAGEAGGVGGVGGVERAEGAVGGVGGRLALVAVNEEKAAWRGVARVRRLRFDGTVVTEAEVPFEAGSGAAAWAGDVGADGERGPAAADLIMAEADGARGWWFFGRDRDVACPPPRWTARCGRVGAELHLSLTAETLLRDLMFRPDAVDPAAEVDENVVTLLPGETRVFRVTTTRDLSVETLTSPPVLRCANEFAM